MASLEFVVTVNGDNDINAASVEEFDVRDTSGVSKDAGNWIIVSSLFNSRVERDGVMMSGVLLDGETDGDIIS